MNQYPGIQRENVEDSIKFKYCTVITASEKWALMLYYFL